MGTLANALRIWCIPLAAAGLLAPVFFIQRVALEHLLFIGGFGLVCLIAASRVIFGHSGAVEKFANRSVGSAADRLCHGARRADSRVGGFPAK